MPFRRCVECARALEISSFQGDDFVCQECVSRKFRFSFVAAENPVCQPTQAVAQLSSAQLSSAVAVAQLLPCEVESVKVNLIKEGSNTPTEVTIVKDLTADQLISYLRGVLQETPVAIGGLPLHPPTLCKELRHGQTYAVLTEKPAAAPELPVTAFPATGTKYDVVVIGSGPGGEAAAVLASQLGARVAVLERRSVFGGPTGLTSKAVRHAIKTILTTSATLGEEKDAIQDKLWSDFPALLAGAQLGQAMETRGRLDQNRAQLIVVDDVKVSAAGTRVTIQRGKLESVLQTKYIIIATGSRPARPATIPFTPDKVVDAGEVATTLGKRLPKSVGIIGGGVVGVEYALMLSSVGVQGTIFTTPDLFMRMLPVVLREEILATLKESNIEVVMDSVTNVEPGDKCIIIAGGQKYESDIVLYSKGRDANSQDLGLEDIGIELGKYGRIVVNSDFQTSVPNIFAIGDVIGGRLASEASKAGRAVAKFIFQGIRDESAPHLFAEKMDDIPLCLWTVPEMSSVGATVEGLQAQGLLPAENGGPIVIGMAKYDNLVQGRLAGGVGFVQIVSQYMADAQCHRIIGAHMFGVYANDLIQLAAILIQSNSTLELVANTPWAAVTMSVLLQHAADDALFRSPYFQPCNN